MDDGSHGLPPTYEVITLRGAHGAALWRWWLRGWPGGHQETEGGAFALMAASHASVRAGVELP